MHDPVTQPETGASDSQRMLLFLFLCLFCLYTFFVSVPLSFVFVPLYLCFFAALRLTGTYT